MIERLDRLFKIGECHVTQTVRGIISYKSVLMMRLFLEEDSKLDDVVRGAHSFDDASIQHFDSG